MVRSYNMAEPVPEIEPVTRSELTSMLSGAEYLSSIAVCANSSPPSKGC